MIETKLENPHYQNKEDRFHQKYVDKEKTDNKHKDQDNKHKQGHPEDITINLITPGDTADRDEQEQKEKNIVLRKNEKVVYSWKPKNAKQIF